LSKYFNDFISVFPLNVWWLLVFISIFLSSPRFNLI
jgi:hypothetical protein